MLRPSRDEVEATGVILTRGWFWLAMVVLTVFVLGTGYWMAKPYWLGLERQAYVASHQYVESQRTAMLDLAAQVEKLDARLTTATGAQKSALASQRIALVDRIKAAADKIPADAIPPRINRIINGG